MENFLPDLPARCAAVAAGKKKKKKKKRGRKETTGKCWGGCAVVSAGVNLWCRFWLWLLLFGVCACVFFYFGSLVVTILRGVSLFSLVLVFDLEIWCSEGSELAHDGDEHWVLGSCNVRRIGA